MTARGLHASALPVPSAAVLRRGGLLLLLLAVLLAVLAQFTSLDIALADRVFDAALQRFPLRDNWFADEFMHRWVKLPLLVLGTLIVLAALLPPPFARPLLSPAGRWRLRIAAALVVLVPLCITLLKRHSAAHCPWSLERYGGNAPYLRLFDALPAGVEPGGCFPAGHASSALWLAGLCVWWLPRRPRMAAAVFAAGLAAGGTLGWVQQLRGAHFLSHTLWSMWIAAALVWAVLFGFNFLEHLSARLERRSDGRLASPPPTL
jgi:membrane-associated PAP2 superfamily phosphatase